jgi:hypothetical protein
MDPRKKEQPQTRNKQLSLKFFLRKIATVPAKKMQIAWKPSRASFSLLTKGGHANLSAGRIAIVETAPSAGMVDVRKIVQG